MASRRERQGFTLAQLLMVHGVDGALCCVVFPHFVGPLDNPDRYSFIIDPACTVERAISTPGSDAMAEIAPPHDGAPGTIVIEAVNRTDVTMHDVVVRYRLREPIAVNARHIPTGLRLSGT